MLSAITWASPVASTTRSKPPTSSRSDRERLSRRRDVARTRGRRQPRPRIACRAAPGRPDVEPREAEEVRREHPDRARSDHERLLELPGLAAADRARVADPALADRRRLHEHAEPSERARDRDQLRRILRHELAREPVQARDPALAVVAREARVGGALVAGEAVRARAPHDRGDEVAACESVAVPLDPAEELVAEHEHVLAVRRDAEVALGDLPVGAADADLERPHEPPRPRARPAAGRQRRASCAPHRAGRRAPASGGGEPAVDDEHGPRRELGEDEVLDRLGDLLRRAEPAQRLPARAARRATRRTPRRGAAPRASRRCRGRRR